MAQRKKKKKSRFTAKTADRHVLYQLSVQDPDYEVEFLTSVYKKIYRKKARSLREDFCGTALLASAWVKSHKKRTATGIDNCGETLAWGKEHNVAPLGDDASRLTLLEQDVRDPSEGKFEIINALNFSYWIFSTREELRGYFQGVRDSLDEQGLFICDAYGGWEAQQPMLEPRRISAGFTNVWYQDSYDPITHHMVNHIHFEFKDGTKMNRAFTYEWRFWSLLEIQELLEEAGFSKVSVYWDQADDEDDEDYRPTRHAVNQPGWLAYLVALP